MIDVLPPAAMLALFLLLALSGGFLLVLADVLELLMTRRRTAATYGRHARKP